MSLLLKPLFMDRPAARFPSYRRGRLAVCLAAVLCSLGNSGCFFSHRDNPFSGSLVSCRQLTQKGIGEMDRNNWQQAETFLQQAVNTCKEDPEAKKYYADALWHRGARMEALLQMEDALLKTPDDPALLLKTAQMYQESNRPEEALAKLNKAIDLEPLSADSFSLRGKIMQSQGNMRQALADYHRALGFEAEHRETRWRTAELYQQLDQPQRALANLHYLAGTYTPGEEPYEVLLMMGIIYKRQDRFHEAIDYLARANSLKPRIDEPLVHLAECHCRLGELAQAEECVRLASQINPERKELRNLNERIRTARRTAANESAATAEKRDIR